MVARARRSLPVVLVLAVAFGGRADAAARAAPGALLPPGRPSGRGEISGRVTRVDGTPLAGVAVTVIGTALLGARSAVTTRAGIYLIARLPAGVYTVTFSAHGDAAAGRREVRLDEDACARVDAQLGERPPLDAAAASTESAMIDPLTTAVVTHATRERLDLLPLWGGTRVTPQIVTAVAAAGTDGSPEPAGAGGASRVASRGWAVEGGTTADDGFTAWPGSLDIQAIEEVQVLRAANDPSWRSGGDVVNLVMRGGSNRFTGNARGTFTGRRLQSDNLTPTLKAQGAGDGNPVRAAGQAGIEMGGPIRRDTAWLWGSATWSVVDAGLIGFYTEACVMPDGTPVAGAAFRAECASADVTTLWTTDLKLQYRWSPAHRSTILWGAADKRRPSRGASAFDRSEHTNRQSSLSFAHPAQARHQWVVTQSLVVDGAFTFSDGHSILDFHDASLSGVQGAYDRYTLVNSRSGVQTEYSRPTTEVTAAAHWFVGGFLGGSHAMSFGIQFLNASTRQWDRTGGGAVAVFDSRSGSRSPYQAQIFRDGAVNLRARQSSAFVEDSYRRGRLTVEVGVRVDRQDDEALPAAIPANRVLPDLLPAVDFRGADSGVVYNDASPRVGVAWDVAGSGTTVVKATASRRSGTGNTSSARLQPTGQTRLVYWWNDADGDGYVQASELDLSRGPATTPSSNYDPANPSSVRSPATVDPRLRNEVADEVTLRVERQLARHVAVRATYVGRKVRQLQAAFPIDADGSLVDSGTFDPVAWAPSNCRPGARCPDVIYYRRGTALPPGTVLRNDGEYSWRHGVDLVVHKRFADGWMLDVSVAWNTAAWFSPRPTLDYTDPTNIAQRSGTEYSLPGPRWAVEVSGSVRLPWGISTAAALSAREGLPYARGVTSPNRGALGSTVVDIGRYGSERYAAVGRLDWRIDRPFTIGRARIVPILNVVNLLNSNVVVARNRIQNSTSANAVTEVLAPRIAHLGASVTF